VRLPTVEHVEARITWKSAFRIAWAIAIVNLIIGFLGFALFVLALGASFSGIGN
jgi:hypothetical protein